MPVRAIRGATQLDVDEPAHLVERTAELLAAMVRANALDQLDVVSILFTATPDLRSQFPAVAVRDVGLGDVPRMCMVEIDVPGALPRVVRVMAHAELAAPRDDVQHVYLHGASVLRPPAAPAAQSAPAAAQP